MKDKQDESEEKNKKNEEEKVVEVPAPVETPKSSPKMTKSILDPEESDLKFSSTSTENKIKQGKTIVSENKTKEGQKTSYTNPLLIVGIVTGLVILVAGGVFFVVGLKSNSQKGIGQEEITATPSPTPKPALERGAITFEVLNASSTSGLAKSGATKLEALGYKVGKTGNYSGEVDQNQIYLSSDLLEKKDLLLQDLKAGFNISTVSGELKNATASGRIILIK